jgi:tRNA-specific 2-thiouridylase
MAMRERILVAMSGGVDSSVAAARLRDAGYDVVGATLHLWDHGDDPSRAGGHGRCCAPEDQDDARRVADRLGLPHFTFDRRELFARAVVTPFVDAYVAGETPSPCSVCNRTVKLAELFLLADRLGASHVATGHYARVVRAPSGVPRLAAGVDRTKDQSYFLYACPRTWLERLAFPLGTSTKVEVRAEAIARELPGAHKGESQELCFAQGGAHAYADFVASRATTRPGAIVDGAGRIVGSHDGVHRFTIGQRKGVGVAMGRPVFVVRIDPDSATVELGDETRLLASEATLRDVTLAEDVTLPVRACVRVRYRHKAVPAYVESSGDGLTHVRFDEPVRAITRGQTAVFYDGDCVLGGGRIDRVVGAGF